VVSMDTITLFDLYVGVIRHFVRRPWKIYFKAWTHKILEGKGKLFSTISVKCIEYSAAWPFPVLFLIVSTSLLICVYNVEIWLQPDFFRILMNFVQ
jgi:hypothetical protein